MENDNYLAQNYEHLSKAQRKKLKKEQKKQEKEKASAERRKKQRIRKIRNYGITILIVLATIGFFYWKSVPPKDAPLLELETNSYNFGRVSQALGVASGSLTISNQGKSDLIVKKMVTSCMCTTASIVIDGEEGPRFGMHDNPTGWKGVIKQGEKTKLKIYYDPNMHPELKGPVTRTITIFSNGHKSPHKITIYANQVS